MLAAMLLMIAVASAQFESIDSDLLSCEKACCKNAGASWSEANPPDNGSCLTNSLNYSSCRDPCMLHAQRSIQAMSPNTDVCCAPGFLICGLVLGAVRFGLPRR
jgi:hypothetical protein